MGCFSYLCNVCGKPINSTSFAGENARLSLIENGKIIEEMQGQYDSYGRTFDENMESVEWKSKDWGDIVDMHFDGNPKNGISAAHVHCIQKSPDYPITKSEDDPDQGWGRLKTYHMGKCETYHKIL